VVKEEEEEEGEEEEEEEEEETITSVECVFSMTLPASGRGGKRSALAANISSVTISSACCISPSTQSYPTPSLNCSFCRHSTSAGRYGFSGVSNAQRNGHRYSIRPI
jgi:hypothetical protein